MNSQNIGLQVDSFTWPLFAALSACWLAGLWVCTPFRRLGWRAVVTSLYGLVWLAFALDIILRFLLLSWDTLFFGNFTLRLASIPPEIINRSLVTLALFWTCFSGAYRMVLRLRLPSPGQSLDTLVIKLSYRLALPVIFLCSACGYLSVSGQLPAAFVTPAALAGSLWVVPAIAIWSDSWSKPMRGLTRVRLIHFLVLLPGTVTVFLNPYRETLLKVFLVPFFAVLFAGRKLKLTWTVAGFAVLLVGLTLLIQVYRIVLWSPLGSEQLAEDQIHWQEDPTTGPGMDLVRRFHGLDSLLITEDLVPSALPYSREDLFMRSVIQGFVPRALYAGKAADNRGIEFGRTIWSYGEPYKEGGGASIAPSMPGDLYHAGGISFVVAGAVIWGLLLGLTEAWKSRLPRASQAVVIALLALQATGSIERDFSFVISTFLQSAVVFCLLVLIISARTCWHRSSPPKRVNACLERWATTPPVRELL